MEPALLLLDWPVPTITRRRFLANAAWIAAAGVCHPRFDHAAISHPRFHFPAKPRDRIAVASYPFRDYIVDRTQKNPKATQTLELKDFPAHVVARFKINKVELWSAHFPSTDPTYLRQMRSAIKSAHAMVVNIAVDGEHSPYSTDPAERDQAIAFSKHWIDVAHAIGSPSVRTNLPPAGSSAPDPDIAAASLRQVAVYAAARNVVVNLENDNPVSEDPLLLVKLIEKVDSGWLHALPDFCNSLAAEDEERAYRGIDAMFAKACNICHVKEMEIAPDGRPVHVDLPKTFGFLKRHAFRGYCSMEFDSPGDPYQGTAELIEKTLQYL